MREDRSQHSDWKRKKNTNGEHNFALSTSQSVKKHECSFFKNVKNLQRCGNLEEASEILIQSTERKVVRGSWGTALES